MGFKNLLRKLRNWAKVSARDEAALLYGDETIRAPGDGTAGGIEATRRVWDACGQDETPKKIAERLKRAGVETRDWAAST
jgi:hypothetical protein